MRVGSKFSASLAILALSACASAPTETVDDAAERLRADIAFLADDARMGRETGTAGYDAAADYVVDRMKSIGLKPSPGGWRQEVRLRSSVRVADAARFEISEGDKTTPLTHPDDYLIGRTFEEPAFDTTAPLVYAGYGVVAREEGVDDYQGLDVAGKIVVAFGGSTPALNGEKRAYYASQRVKLKEAQARGAVGFVTMMTTEAAAKERWPLVARGVARAGMATIGPDGRAELAAPTVRASASLSVAGATKVLEGEAMDYAALQAAEAKGNGAPKGFALSKKARIAGASILSEAESDNVIGVIEGSDPFLKNEVILLTAHLDHLGVLSDPKPGEDAINNGALDNAAGVAVLIEAANALAASGAPPRRTVAFAAVTGEEKGLLGSEYLARHPAFGRKRVVANVNLDMPVTLYPFTDVIAFGAERSTIGASVRRAATAMGIDLSPDPIPAENIFVRSDHFSFVREGTPAVYLFMGFANGGEAAFGEFLKAHYHKPSDDLSQKIDYDALARLAELNYRVVRDLADADETPRWIEGDFFGELFSK
jgi:Zn-dependent M28 family amino/carboxypeptidase